ncbi:hypothetical protein [Bradyrhizobium elkanii]|uniref:hypothetical protein n=1 Tax=Bradyrhizobium elkanii TaxID=29448 RepID=UPI003D1C7936
MGFRSLPILELSQTETNKDKLTMEIARIFEKPDPVAGEPRYVRVKAALKLMGCGRSKLYRLLNEGRITAVRLDGSTYVDTASVAALFAACPTIRPKLKDEPPSRELLQALGFPVAPDDRSLTLSIAEDDLCLDDRMARQLRKREGR